MSTTLTAEASTVNAANNTTMNTLKSKWQNFNGGDRQAAVMAVFAIAVAIVIVLMLWSASQGYRPLYGNQENVDTAQIIEVLESEGIAYQLDASSGLVLVAEDKLGQARMLLAARGVKAKVPSGMDSLENSGIGTSQFMEQAKYRYSLEGELSRTIMALKAVRNARVHLAIPKKTLFIRQQPELPSASVMLDLYSGSNIQPENIESIVNLVAGSVSGLTPERVQVIDQNGHYLSAAISANQDITQAKDRQLKYTHELEQSLIGRASSMLQPILGLDNFKVQVSALVNFNQVEETKESLDPVAVITQENQISNESNADLALGIPGALSNQPPNAAENDNNSRRNINKNESRQFDVGRSVRHTRFQQMQLENLSVSVLLNSQAAGENGWSQPQLDQLSTMVQDAIGFSQARGDQFSMNSFAFAPISVAQFEPMPWWEGESTQAYLRYFIGAILGLGMILFVLRPLVSHLTRTANNHSNDDSNAPEVKQISAVEATDTATADDAQPLSLQSQTQDKTLAHNEWGADFNLPETGSPLTVKMEHLSLLANQEPGRVAEVISHWINDKSEQPS